MKKVLQKVKIAISAVLVAFLFWTVISWMDVCLHNTSDGDVHSWNMFQIIVDQVEMSEQEYYEQLDKETASGNCDRCIYGCCEECHLQCNKSYEDYMREARGWLEDVGF